MKIVRFRLDPASPPTGRINEALLDATTEEMIRMQQAADDREDMQQEARFVRRLRRRLGLTQIEFARKIGVPVMTVRTWESGRQPLTGIERSLLRILDREPEAALSALS
jgi:putative transcriptional regulator